MTFLPSGELVTAGRPGVTIWDVRTGEFRLLPLPGVWLRSILVSPTSTVWTGDSEGVIREWDLEAGRVVRRLDDPGRRSVIGLAMTPDGTRLHWLTDDSLLGTTDLATGELQGEPRKLDRQSWSLVPSSTGAYLAAITNRAVELRDGASADLIERFEYGEKRLRPRSAAFSPDEAHLVMGIQHPPRLEHFLLPSLETGPLHEWPVDQAGPYELVFFPEGDRIAYGQIRDTTVLAFPGGEVLATLPQEKGGYVAALAVSPDGETLVTYGAEGQLRFWDPVRRRPRLRYDARGSEVYDVLVDDERDLVITGDEAGRVRRWSLADGEEVQAPVELPAVSACRLEFLEDGSLQASTAERHGALQPWIVDLDDGSFTGPGRRYADDRAFLPARTPDGSLELHPGGPRTFPVQILDLGSGEVLSERKPHEGGGPRKPGTRLAAFHPSGRYCATAGEDQHVRLHTAPDFEEVLALAEPLGLRGYFPRSPKWSARRLRFSPDGRLLVLGGVDGSLFLYELELVDARRPRERLRIERRVHVVAHTAPVHALAFARSSSLLVTASADGSALVWDVDHLLSEDHRSLDLPPSPA
jgi:WD40 repeat protein